MSDAVRLLNDEGVAAFEQFVAQLRKDPTIAIPSYLLKDPTTSTSAPFAASIDPASPARQFKSAYELGEYLCNSVLAGIDKPLISRDYRLWNWLSLFLFEELCPQKGGKRDPLETAAYVFDKHFNYARYYRHLVRSAWVLVSVHGTFSKVLLTPGTKGHANPVAVRTDIQMQLSATQQFVESSNVVKAAYALYFDEKSDHLKAGSATKGDGAPRRLVSVLNQFDLTYDLHDAPTETLVALMPEEFDRFKNKQGSKKKPPGQSA